MRKSGRKDRWKYQKQRTKFDFVVGEFVKHGDKEFDDFTVKELRVMVACQATASFSVGVPALAVVGEATASPSGRVPASSKKDARVKEPAWEVVGGDDVVVGDDQAGFRYHHDVQPQWFDGEEIELSLWEEAEDKDAKGGPTQDLLGMSWRSEPEEWEHGKWVKVNRWWTVARRRRSLHPPWFPTSRLFTRRAASAG